MLLNKVMGNFLAHGSQAEPLIARKEGNSSVGMHTKTHRDSTETVLYTMINLDICIVSIDSGGEHLLRKSHTLEVHMV